METFPESIESKPDRQFKRVVLPEPLGPITATISPSSTSMETSTNALTVISLER